jgi:carbonic anhydrase
MNPHTDKELNQLLERNLDFQKKYKNESHNHVKGQSPNIAVLTCADSRVIPEHIFQAGIGELFVVRIAGNIAVDETVIASLEYAVDYIHISHLIILAHTFCGAVKSAEETKETESLLLTEIQKSFPTKEDHVLANLHRQLSLLPQRSNSIKKAMEQDNLKLVGALYHIEDGSVEFIE